MRESEQDLLSVTQALSAARRGRRSANRRCRSERGRETARCRARSRSGPSVAASCQTTSRPAITAIGSSQRLIACPPSSASRARSRAAVNPGEVTASKRGVRRGRRRCQLGDHAARPAREDDDPVAEIERFLDIVGDQQRRPALVAERRGEPLLHLGAGDRVERGERLVEQQTPACRPAASAGTRPAGASRPRARPAGCVRSPRGRSARTAAPPRARASAREDPRLRSASAALSIAGSQGSSRSRCGM